MDEETICNTKFLLYCFEAMSGLRINYQKSDIFVLEATIEKQREIADLFNSNIGTFPLKYLAVMLDIYYMSSEDFAYVYQKVEKRVPNLAKLHVILWRQNDPCRILSKFNS